jgi:hypothetical protein
MHCILASSRLVCGLWSIIPYWWSQRVTKPNLRALRWWASCPDGNGPLENWAIIPLPMHDSRDTIDHWGWEAGKQVTGVSQKRLENPYQPINTPKNSPSSVGDFSLWTPTVRPGVV